MTVLAVDLVPVLVVGYPVTLFTAALVMCWRAVRVANLDAAAERARSADLPVPAGAAPIALVPVSSSPSHGRGHGRDGQHRVDRVAVQERAARDTLRCQGARVDVAPVRCPLDRGRS